MATTEDGPRLDATEAWRTELHDATPEREGLARRIIAVLYERAA